MSFSTDTAIYVGITMISLWALLALYNTFLQIRHRQRIQPDPVATYATKPDLARVESQVEKVAKERQTSVAGLHKRIDDIEVETARNTEKTNLTYDLVTDMDKKFDSKLDRLLSTVAQINTRK